MAKIAIIADTHFGVRNDAIPVAEYMEYFFRTKFFPELVKRSIDTVIHCGDIFHRRKYINFLTFNKFQQSFFEKLVEHNIKMYAIPGNHDCPLKNVTSVNSLDIMLKSKYPNVEIFNTPEQIELGGKQFLFVPWISNENGESTLEAIESSTAQYVVGHFEINGFEVHAGSIMDHGLEMSLFQRFDLVMSGHFHKRGTIGNITYVGTPYQMAWSDHGMVKGFHVLDTETGELEFVPNEDELFISISYDDAAFSDASDIQLLDLTREMNVMGRYVRVVVRSKTNPYLYDLLINQLESQGALSVQINDTTHSLSSSIEEGEDGDEVENTESFIARYIGSLDLASTSIDKDALTTLMLSLYHQALMSSSTVAAGA